MSIAKLMPVFFGSGIFCLAALSLSPQDNLHACILFEPARADRIRHIDGSPGSGLAGNVRHHLVVHGQASALAVPALPG
jgi:hypothetical protein